MFWACRKSACSTEQFNHREQITGDPQRINTSFVIIQEFFSWAILRENNVNNVSTHLLILQTDCYEVCRARSGSREDKPLMFQLHPCWLCFFNIPFHNWHDCATAMMQSHRVTSRDLDIQLCFSLIKWDNVCAWLVGSFACLLATHVRAASKAGLSLFRAVREKKRSKQKTIIHFIWVSDGAAVVFCNI